MSKIKSKILAYIAYCQKVNQLNCRKEQVRTLYDYYSYNNHFQGVDESDDAPDITVSLTTFGKRIYTVHYVIESLMMQTMKPKRIVLWLAEEEFKNQELPCLLVDKMSRGLQIKYCKDLKSYKKLIPCLKEFPNSHIITVDDDVIYPYDLIENLWMEHKKHNDDIIFTRGRIINIDENGNVAPYHTWENNLPMGEGSYKYLPIGVGGVFYPTGALNEQVFSEKDFMAMAPNADDLWFKTMALLNKRKARQTNYGLQITSDDDFVKRFISIEDEQNFKLSTQNILNNGNDVQFQNLIDNYDLRGILKQ